MKLNEITSGKVWLLIAEENYEAPNLHGIYTSKSLAEKALKTDFKNMKYKSESSHPTIKEVTLNSFNDLDWLP